jgi:hypothetical protein
LKENVKQLQTKAKLILATTTPINVQKHSERTESCDPFRGRCSALQLGAENVMKQTGIEIDGLHVVVMDAGMDNIQLSDGTHYKWALGLLVVIHRWLVLVHVQRRVL